MSVQPPSYDKSQEAAGQSLFCIFQLIQSTISGGAYPPLPNQGVNPGYQGSQGMGNMGHQVPVPGYGQAGGRQVVVIQQQMLGPDPVTTTCPYCQANVSHQDDVR